MTEKLLTGMLNLNTNKETNITNMSAIPIYSKYFENILKVKKVLDCIFTNSVQSQFAIIMMFIVFFSAIFMCGAKYTE